ncbi:peptidoglycan-recognition protein 2-like [Macrosteles quadrilineatus]|uniref:peptidoglycan-recognition protein 2-like n=1 Tax=Macrosteles quadrilineatus TaxID=74068 RepID=UPI0023E1759A|nr:peptidoglycan-recognition protein 2-like [Macrosteles quadrilineatus]
MDGPKLNLNNLPPNIDAKDVLASLKSLAGSQERARDEVGHRITLIPRSKWGALPPSSTTPLPNPINTVVFAYNTEQPVCTTEEECCAAMKQMQLKHMQKGLSDIYYNFCVGGDNAMYEGRGWTTLHSKEATFLKRNLPLGNCLVIGVIGDGKTDIDWRPEYELVAPAMRMINQAIKEGKIIETHNTIEENELIKECSGSGC